MCRTCLAIACRPLYVHSGGARGRSEADAPLHVKWGDKDVTCPLDGARGACARQPLLYGAPLTPHSQAFLASRCISWKGLHMT